MRMKKDKYGWYDDSQWNGWESNANASAVYRGTYYDIATNYHAWQELFDRAGEYTEEQFEEMETEEKIKMIEEHLGPEKIKCPICENELENCTCPD